MDDSIMIEERFNVDVLNCMEHKSANYLNAMEFNCGNCRLGIIIKLCVRVSIRQAIRKYVENGESRMM